MNSAKRIVVNTAAQYVKTAINIVLSLYSTRLVLECLGVEDYGIYTLIAGIVSLLSFAVNALVTTTQRYMSFHAGKGNVDVQKDIFNNSLFIHIFLGVFVAICIELAGLFVFNGFVNIAEDRIYAAKVVYHYVTIMIVLSFFTAPYRAALVAHENIVYISIIDIIDGILKVVIAILISTSNGDRLITYATLLMSINMFNFLAFAIYSYIRFDECIAPKISRFNILYVKDIASFAGWTIYSIGCIVGRTQGISIIINKCFGVVVNAAYGVALQVNSAVMFLSNSILNSMNPQIMKAEGMGNREKMLRLAESESKFSFLILGAAVIPCIFEMESILSLWLKDVPEYSVHFCRLFLLASLIDQLTIGLGSANQAIGNIKLYSLVINTIKLVTIPVVLFCLYMSNNVHVVMGCFVLFEFICAICRLPFLKKTAGISITNYVIRVFAKEIIPIITITLSCYLITKYCFIPLRFLLTFSISIILYIASILMFGLNNDERTIINSLINKH